MKDDYPNRIKIPGTAWYKNKPGKPQDWGPSLTSQEFKDECDTEKILERYSNAGLPLPVAAVNAVYGDFSDLSNLQDHLNNARALVQQAEEGFMQLDARTRKRFDNDVAKMVAWLEDPENYEESIKLGLRESKAHNKPLDVIVRTDTNSGSPNPPEGGKEGISPPKAP